ncbi:AbrB/MazE/SpoVT family DNA-binding domain-containing protein [Salipaludibacillus sp. CF4.18]|uniref:AbrB/MazE/SpoVT family DNA-binding domain-containing protein n=1 Tax=Salipaludibacillus sp. CF4.18 TaxID=3373081 RepID=UPI003EE7E587
MIKTFKRQVDTVGRIVIPKEIREALDFSQGELEMKVLTDKKGIKLSKAKNTTKDSKTLDRYGRLIIPSDIRENLAWNKNMEIEFKLAESFVVLNDRVQVCEFCGNGDSLVDIKSNFLCENCLDIGNKQRNIKWLTPINSLVSDYISACERTIHNKDTIDIQQAKETGEKIEALFALLKIPPEHTLLVKMKEADKLLEKISETDALSKDFESRNEVAEDVKHAEVYAQMKKFAEKKRKKQDNKLENKLPQIIDNGFVDSWEEFKNSEFPSYVASFNFSNNLDEQERSIKEAKEAQKTAVEDQGEESLAVVEVNKQLMFAERRIAVMYDYLDDIQSNTSFKNKAAKYEKEAHQLQKQTSVNNRLTEFEKTRKNLDGKKKHIKAVKQELMEELHN